MSVRRCAVLLVGFIFFYSVADAQINNKIIYSKTDKTIWATSGDGTADQFLADGYFPHLSADGRYLVYLNGPNGEFSSQNNIYTKDLQTNVVTLVFSNNDYVVSTSWSNDGSKIYFDYGCNVWYMNRDGSGMTNITGSDCYDDGPTIRLTDGAVTFHNEHNGIFYMDANGGGRTFVSNTAPGDFWPTWSPDGQWIVFGRYTGSGGSLINIFKIKPDGSSLTQLTNLAGNQVGPWRVSNDGLSVFAAGTIGCASGIYEFPMDGSQTFRLINNAGSTGTIDWIGSEIGTPPLAYISGTSPPTITSFTPTASPIGWTIVITGTDFNTTPANNTVKFNGVAAAVSASSTTSLTVVVPTGATTGTVTVTTPCGTGASASAFTIAPVNYNSCRSDIQLNGTTDGVRITDNATLHAASLTLEAMVNFSSIPSGFAQIIGKPYQPATGVAESFAIHYTAGRLFGGINPVAATINATWTPTLNQWYHVALTYNQSTGISRLYVDGAEVANGTAPANVYDATDVLIGMDIDNGVNTGFFSGQIDEVRIWNLDRTPSQLQSTVTSTLVGNEPGLIAYYKLDDSGVGPGLTAINSASATGAALNGTTLGSSSTPVFQCTCPVGITSFAPASGLPGSTVIIAGTNFDLIPANNQVKFNGVAATVTAASGNSLTVIVPTTATTGLISVKVCGTTSSATSFTVIVPVITISTQPSDVAVCRFATGTFAVSATGTTNLSYQWQFATTSSGPFNDISNSSGYSGVTTNTLTVNATGNFGSGRYRCRIDGDFAAQVLTIDKAFTITNVPCSNAPPVVRAYTGEAAVGDHIYIMVASLVSDPDNNLDISTLSIVSPPISGAPATIDVNEELDINYTGVVFSGTDEVTIKVCDLAGSCTQQVIKIDIEGDVVIYNAVSPNGDGKNDVFFVKSIDIIPNTKDNKVTIFDRWGNIVFEVEDYDNVNRVFRGVNQNGSELPAGTYFYKIVFSSGLDSKTGFISLRK